MKKNKSELGASVKLPTEVHAKMKVHVDKLGMKIQSWLSRVVERAVDEETKHYQCDR